MLYVVFFINQLNLYTNCDLRWMLLQLDTQILVWHGKINNLKCTQARHERIFFNPNLKQILNLTLFGKYLQI